MTPPEQTNPNHNYPSDEINLKELWDVLWGGKKLIILITAFFAICSVFYASNLTNYYKSEFPNDFHTIRGDQEIEKIHEDILKITKNPEL